VNALVDVLLPPAASNPFAATGVSSEYRLHRSYLPFPAFRVPKLLIPVDTPLVAAAALKLRAASAQSLPTRLALAAAVPGLATGLLQVVARSRVDVLVRSRSAAALPGVFLADYLSTVLGTDVLLSAKISSYDPHRTLGLHLLTKAGSLAAYAKVGAKDLTQGLIRNEAEALRRMATVSPTLIRAPALLHHGPWRHLELLVTAPLELTHGTQPSPSSPPSLAATVAVASSGRRTVSALEDSGYWQSTRARAGQLLGSGQLNMARQALLSYLLDRLEADCGAVSLQFGAWHGDWLPWNLSWQGGRLLAWDWEYSSDSAPLGFDVLHFFCGTSFFRDRRDARVALAVARARGLPKMRPTGMSSEQLAVLHSLYVLEFLLRRLDITAQGGGEDDARVFPSITEAVKESLAATTTALR
jgi:hypothetical protein